MTKALILDSADSRYNVLVAIQAAVETGKVHEVIIQPKPAGQRTIPQNKSLHKWCGDLAKQMTDAGFTQKKLLNELKSSFDLPVTMEMIKRLFRLAGKEMYGKDSTAKLTTVETQKVYQAVDKRFSEITGIHIEWPTRKGR